jgi:hypothetical protein
MTATEEAIRAGIDLSLIELSLSYSYEKRAEQHQAALELALELERIGRELRGAGSKRISTRPSAWSAHFSGASAAEPI